MGTRIGAAIFFLVAGIDTGCCLKPAGEPESLEPGPTPDAGVSDAGPLPYCIIAGAQFPNRSSNPADPSQCCNSSLDGFGWSPRFVPGSSATVAGGFDSLSAVDFNGDGWLDLASPYNYISGEHGVFVFLNGSSVLQAPVAYGVGLVEPSYMGVDAIFPLDHDGAGSEDLVIEVRRNAGIHPPVAPDSLNILSSDGITASYDADLRPSAVVNRCATGLFFGNRMPGIVCGEIGLPSLVFFGGNGDGGLKGPVTFGDAGPHGDDYDGPVVLGDFNSDGLLDVAVGKYWGSVSVFLATADGGFVANGSYSAGPPGTLIDLAVGDFNGDVILDMVITGWLSMSSGSVGILVGNGDGTFESGANYPSPQGRVGGLAVADVDSSGADQLILSTITSTDGGAVVWNSAFQVDLRDGWKPLPLRFESAPVLVGDFNGDHAPDIVSATWPDGQNSRTIQIYLNGCP